MDYAAERTIKPGSEQAEKRGVWQILRHYATPKLTAAAIIWRIESYTYTPLVIFCIEVFGRWNGALVVGLIMAVNAALFLFLLEGERALDALREWLRDRRMVKRLVLPVKNSEGMVGTAGRWLAAPASVMLLAVFERAVAYRVLGLKNRVAYPLSCLGQIPRSLFWAGLVFGSAYELLFRPTLVWVWEQIEALAGVL